MKSIEDKGCCNYGPAQDNSSINTCNFEFHKGSIANNNSNQRTVLGSLSKPTPSKWDDAQKWLVGLSSGEDPNYAKYKPRISNAEDSRLIGTVPQRGKDSCNNSEERADYRGPEIMNQDEGETKKIDCNESFWRINKPMEDSLSDMRSVCVRDMGTEMTPIASQEPSRTGTPLRATTPAVRSPISSRSSSPGRCHQGSQAIETHQTGGSSLGSRSDVVLFGRANSIGWPTREGSDAYNIVEKRNLEQVTKPNSLETRAIAWDEAERAKYMARYKSEEVKIQAWENHEKRKAEMEMRRMEVKADRLKLRGQERLTNKLAATRRIAEEKKANAAAKMNEQAVRTSERADYIRRTGHMPSSFSSFKLPSCCW
ncbi:hypothetical protein AAC387_Pa12g1174 [Persea americana]